MIAYELDPNRKFLIQDPQVYLDACGILLSWAQEALNADKDMLETMQALYPFPVAPATGISFNEDGSWDYPGDPTQYPLVKVSSSKTKDVIYVYRNAWVGFYYANGSRELVRMD